MCGCGVFVLYGGCSVHNMCVVCVCVCVWLVIHITYSQCPPLLRYVLPLQIFIKIAIH